MPIRNEAARKNPPGMSLERPAGPDITRGPDIPVGHPLPPDDHLVRQITAGLPAFEEARAADRITALREQLAVAIVETGQILVQAREFYRSGGGFGSTDTGFAAFVARCNMSLRTAYNYISVVLRLAEVGILDGSPLLRLSASMAKVLAITELTEDDRDRLERGESVDGIGTLDEIDRMRAGELRKRVRDVTHEKDTAKSQRDEEHTGRVNAELALAEAKRQLADGPLAPNDIETAFASALSGIARWCASMKDHPRVAREAALESIMNMYNQYAQTIISALLPEKYPQNRQVTTDHLIGEDGG